MTDMFLINDQAIDQLSSALEALPPMPEGDPSHPKTFMDIAGYKETKFSNMLAFYMSPEEEHGLGDLLPQALLECVGRGDDLEVLSSGEVHTEYSAEGKRIDIVAVYEDLLIGIENKLWSVVHNDLALYGKELDKLAKERSIPENNVVKILLAPDKKTDEKIVENGFKAVTYEELFEKVKVRLAEHIHLPSKYITYLVDMFFTLCKPKPNPMERYKKYEPFIKFLQEHRESFERAKKIEGELHKETASHMKKFCDEDSLENQEYCVKINQKLEKEGLGLMRWIYRKSGVIYDHYRIKDRKIRGGVRYRIDIGVFVEISPAIDSGGVAWGVCAGFAGKHDEVTKKLVEEKNYEYKPNRFNPKDNTFPLLEDACQRGMEVFLEVLNIIDEQAEASSS